MAYEQNEPSSDPLISKNKAYNYIGKLRIKQIIIMLLKKMIKT